MLASHITAKRSAFQKCSLSDETHLIYVSSKPFINTQSCMAKAAHERFSKPCTWKVSVCFQDRQDNKLIDAAAMLRSGHLHNMSQELALQFMNEPFRQ